MKKLEKKIYLSPPHLNGSELEFIKKAIDSNWIAPIGPDIDEFEKRILSYTERDFGIAISSGTAGLHLALKILEIKEGDYVFCSDLTFIASANAIRYVNAHPIFIDSDLKSWNMCAKSLNKAFKQYSPKAVIITNLYGQSANYNELIEICDKNNTPIIEDSAESLGAEYNNRKCGSFGTLSILSFNGNKIITTSGGGMILSNNEDLILKAKKLSTQSRENKIFYEHKEIGYNYRMSNILAAIGIAQLDSLDDYVKIKRKIFNIYKKKLSTISGINFMPEILGGKSTNWLSALILKKNSFLEIKKMINFFNKKNIELRHIWKPMHLQPLYKGYELYFIEKNPVSKFLFYHGLCLPSGCSLTDDDLSLISTHITKYLKK